MKKNSGDFCVFLQSSDIFEYFEVKAPPVIWYNHYNEVMRRESAAELFVPPFFSLFFCRKGEYALKKLNTAALLTAIAVILNGCSFSGNKPEPSPFAPDESERLVVYTSHKAEIYEPIIKEFEERTGIWVETVLGGSSELLQRIADESDSPVADVMFGGGVESLEAYRDCFSPYVCADCRNIDEAFLSPDSLKTPFSSLPVVLIYNTKLVEPERISCWSDLLNPDFKGRIAFCDPAVSGSSFTGLMTMLTALGGDREDILSRFAENLDGRQLESSGDVLSSVADGVDFVGITLEETAIKYIASGADIAMVYPGDGTSCVPDASALVKGAPHSENAKRFLDFTASAEVQRLLTEKLYRRSVRRDIAPPDKLIAAEEIVTLNYDIAYASQNREAVLMTWAFYLGGGEEP